MIKALGGDIISITEKIDGSNASIRYNTDSSRLECFSRKQVLSYDNTLAGFWNFVQSLNPELFRDLPNYYIFGEWLRKNKIIYDTDKMLKWYVYSIYDAENKKWLSPNNVKEICKTHNLTYVHELYYGPFISWEHCRSFMHTPAYGERQEGVVVRNITRLENPVLQYPHILKIVNDDFAETMKNHVRSIDPEKERERLNAYNMMESIITRNRVEKGLLKLRDEGIIPSEISPEDMGIIAKNLPKRIYEDCLKEEPEILKACGELSGKFCNTITMKIAREIVCV